MVIKVGDDVVFSIKFLKVVFLFLLVVFGFALGMIYSFYDYRSMDKVSTDLCVVAGLELTDSDVLYGFYRYTDDVYCVRTDMSWYENRDTVDHESCHAMVDKDVEHFCGMYYK